MEFNVHDRLILINALPQQGTAADLRILRDFQNEASFTDEEKKAVNMVEKDGRLNWSSSTLKEIEVGETMKRLIVKALTEMLQPLEDAGTLPMTHLPLWERFVAAGES